MNRDHKIEKINSYRKLINTGKLPKSEPGNEVSQEICKEFNAWVEGQISTLLGEGTTPTAFTESEIQILKTLAQRVQSKTTTPPAVTAPVSEIGITSSETPRIQLRPNKAVRPSKEQSAFAAQLDRMDQEGPEF